MTTALTSYTTFGDVTRFWPFGIRQTPKVVSKMGVMKLRVAAASKSFEGESERGGVCVLDYSCPVFSWLKKGTTHELPVPITASLPQN